MFDQSVLTATVTCVLGMQLRNRHMALIDDEQIILRKVIKQGERRLARLTIIDMHRVVLNAVAISHLLHHLEVVTCSHA